MAQSNSPQVTVAIVAYQSGDFLQPCLDALAAQTYRDFEAVIVDNDSTDGSVEAVRLPDARFRVVKLGRNTGFAVANNVAARASMAPWLATLNPDTRADPQWLEKLLTASARWPGAASFGSTQIRLDNPGELDVVGDVYHAAGRAWRARLGRPISDVPPEGEVFGPCAAAALYRRDVFLQLGGFDETYFCYSEDVDLAYRVIQGLAIDGHSGVFGVKKPRQHILERTADLHGDDVGARGHHVVHPQRLEGLGLIDDVGGMVMTRRLTILRRLAPWRRLSPSPTAAPSLASL